MVVLSEKKNKYKVDPLLSLIIIKKALTFVVIAFTIIYGLASPVYAIKFILNVIVCYVTAREVEMLFLTHQRPMNRLKARAMIKDTKPEITGIILALLLPVSLPLYVSIIGVTFAIFIVRMAFGGFSFNIFNSAIAAYIFIKVSFASLMTSVKATGLLDYLLSLIIPVDYTKAHSLLLNNIDYNAMKIGSLNHLSLAMIIVLLIAFIYLSYKKIINPLYSVLAIIIFLLLFSGLGLRYFALSFILSPLVMIVIIFSLNDPITTPNNYLGMLIFISIFIGLTLFITVYKHNDGAILFALLLSNMIMPLIDAKISIDYNKVKVWLLSFGLLIAFSGLSFIYLRSLPTSNNDIETKVSATTKGVILPKGVFYHE
jgi:Na+-translocating ferredoxin:NAD+ oxidoreductase RnfD subunit